MELAGLKYIMKIQYTSMNGAGIFAGIFMTYFSLLPVADERRLNDGVLRKNFIEYISMSSALREQMYRGVNLLELALHNQTENK